MQYENIKNSFTKVVVLTAVLITFWAPKVKAGSGQDVAVKIGVSIASSILGEQIKRSLFPKQGIDYNRLRRLMEDVTKKVVSGSVVSQVEGRLKGQNLLIHTAMYIEGKTFQKRHDELERIFYDMNNDLNSVSSDFFATDSFSTYIAGASVELSVLSAMYFFARCAAKEEARDALEGGSLIKTCEWSRSNQTYSTDESDEIKITASGDMNSAMSNFRGRLVNHYNQMGHILKVQEILIKRRALRINCSRYGSRFPGYKWWLQDNDWDGNRLIRNWYSDTYKCNDAWTMYADPVLKKFIEGLNDNDKMGWLHDIAKSWYALGTRLGLFTVYDRIQPDLINFFHGSNWYQNYDPNDPDLRP
jgi:hypothetical protein